MNVTPQFIGALTEMVFAQAGMQSPAGAASPELTPIPLQKA